MLRSGPSRKQRGFTVSDYNFLSDDGLNRFKSSDPYASYALVAYSFNGTPISASQFSYSLELPELKKLKSISLGTLNHGIIEATTVDNERMTTQRCIQFRVSTEGGEPTLYNLYFFSPKQNDYGLSWDSHNQYEDYAHLTTYDESRGGTIVFSSNGSNSSDDSESHSDSTESSNTTMISGKAVDAYRGFCESNQPSRTLYKIFSKAIDAPNRYAHNLNSFKRPEWCHAIAKQFAFGRDFDKRWNLGAAPFWMNSQMMIFEGATRWHHTRYPNATIEYTSFFNMFDDSDVVCRGEMEVEIKQGNRTITMSQHLRPHQKNPAYPQVTDIAIATFVLNNFFLRKKLEPIFRVDIPASEEDIALLESLRSIGPAPSVPADPDGGITDAEIVQLFESELQNPVSEEDIALLESLRSTSPPPSTPLFSGKKRTASDFDEGITDAEVIQLFEDGERHEWKLKRTS